MIFAEAAATAAAAAVVVSAVQVDLVCLDVSTLKCTALCPRVRAHVCV